MNFKFECPHCQQRIAASPADAGTVGTCPTCKKQLTVPAPPPSGRIVSATSPPPQPTAAPVPNPNNLRPGQVIGILFLVGVAIAGYAIYQSDPNKASNPLSSVFEDRYKVTMPNGDIVTMTESEFQAYNKKVIADQEAARQKLSKEINKLSEDLNKSADELRKTLNK